MQKLTPMMAQYKSVKEKYQDAILMYRLGDFYEMFFEDALEASKILQITLTARHKGSENQVPMCGVPYHAVQGYIAKLTKAGKKVAICDQITEPTGKGIVEREVLKIITPGTTFDENILDGKANNYVAAISIAKNDFAIAHADITTGEFKVTQLDNFKDFETEFLRISPAECICSKSLLENLQLKNLFGRCEAVSVFPFEYNKEAEKELLDNFEIKSLEIFGLAGKNLAILSAAILLDYLRETQKTDLGHIRKIHFYTVSQYMPLDQSLLRNLEIFYTAKEGRKENTLVWVLDQTVTAMGGRLLKKWLINPLLKKDQISKRLDDIEIFVKDSSLLRVIRDLLENVLDIERLISKLSLGSGNSRDLLALNQSLKIIPEIKNLLGNKFPEILDLLHDLEQLVVLIDKGIVEQPPLSVRDGGMIKTGFNTELDDLKSISNEGKTFIKDLQERESKRSGINSLKVKFNKVFGYYIEISNTNLHLVPEDFIRKQTLVNAERFITPELKEYEEKVLNAEEKIVDLEYELFYQIRMEVIKEIVRIQDIAKAIAYLDVVANLAFVAVKNNYCRPEVHEGSKLEIVAGRHPVIERIGSSFDFVPNDCVMEENKKFMLITGPNMGGKSTYLRQVALIVLMAQIGSFVPADKANISLVDRIFTRVGASDNLVKGESTFMVEMNEASYILHQATEKSLIILDEIGRGTSTYDGVSIAWAIMEFIHDKIGAKTLFATHYHELIELAQRLPKAFNLSAYVRENEEEGVVFLYKIIQGAVDKSYGIEVAKLAGLPEFVVERARGVLDELETKQIKKSPISSDQMGLFEADKERSHKQLLQSEFLKELKNMDINKITPIEALQKLDEIKKRSAS